MLNFSVNSNARLDNHVGTSDATGLHRSVHGALLAFWIVIFLLAMGGEVCVAAEEACVDSQSKLCPPPAQPLAALQLAAQHGDPEAQFNLAWAYHDGGYQLPQDDAEALRWWRKAAEQGYARAQYDLGKAYDLGIGVQQDHVEAIRWWRKAAAQGEIHSENNIGQNYYDGMGVKQDFKKALYWWHRAAARNDSYAEENIGRAYFEGKGVPQSDINAVKWWRKAAEEGMPKAQFSLGLMYEDGRGGLAKDHAEAIKWWKKAAEQNYTPASDQLAKQH
jgi:TPR repeat protein